MSDAMLPFLPRPSTALYTKELRNKVERHTSVRKSSEDEPDLAEETYHPINEVIHAKTYSRRQLLAPESHDDDRPDADKPNADSVDYFV